MTTIPVYIRRVIEGDEEQIIRLYRAGDWWTDGFDEASLSGLIKGSFAFLVAIAPSSGNIVGMGRLISDGASDAYIHDLIVLPGYRDQGIGTTILDALLAICHENHIGWIGLIAGPKTEYFYTRAGFRRMGGFLPMLYEGS
jgi:aralkylamine N-acetyltransferase